MPDMDDLLSAAGLKPSASQRSEVKPGSGSRRGASQATHSRPTSEEVTARTWVPFPSGYPDYFGSDGCLRREFLTACAESIAIALGEGPLTKVQMRHFYNYVRRRQTALEAGKSTQEALNEIAQLKSIAHRQKERKAIPELFAQFIERNVDKCVDEKAFLKGFVKHFQAVLAFSEGRLRERG